MPPHIDQYSAHYSKQLDEITWSDPQRLYEGQDAIDHDKKLKAAGYLSGRFNGYLFTTALHEDEECASHRPHGRLDIVRLYMSQPES